MRIEEERVYLFKFPYENTELAIPVRAQSRDEAAEKLKKVVSGIQTDLALEFPSVAPQVMPTLAPMPGDTGIPALVLELRIDELLLQLGSKEITDAGKIKLVKKWTSMDYVPENFQAIVTALESLKHGKEEGTA